jgi:hypothetical protein
MDAYLMTLFKSFTLSLLLLLLLDESQHAHLDGSKSFPLLLDDLLQLSQSFFNQVDLSVVKFSRFFRTPFHKKACSVLHEVYLIVLYKTE